MFRSALRGLAVIGGTAAVTYAFALTGATDAKAEPATTGELAYIATLDNYDVYYANDDAAISLGYDICRAFELGAAVEDVIDIGVSSTGGFYSSTDVAHIAGAAVGALCPHVDPPFESSLGVA